MTVTTKAMGMTATVILVRQPSNLQSQLKPSNGSFQAWRRGSLAAADHGRGRCSVGSRAHKQGQGLNPAEQYEQQ